MLARRLWSRSCRQLVLSRPLKNTSSCFLWRKQVSQYRSLVSAPSPSVSPPVLRLPRTRTTVAAQARFGSTSSANHNKPVVLTEDLRQQLEARANSGDAAAQFQLGVLYCFGTQSSSEDCRQSSPPKGPAIDPASLDFLIGPGYVVPKVDREDTRITNWKEWLKEERRKLKGKKTNQSDGSATNAESTTSEPDSSYALAAKWFRESALQGHSLAQHFLAMLMLRGLGVDKDVEEALSWLTKSASGGNSLSCYELGQLYYDGTVVPKDLAKSHGYFTQAADLDNSNAQYWIGYCYHQGLNVESSNEKALLYLQRAAEQQHPGALYYLGMMYRSGEGVPQDNKKMLEYFTASAAEGEPEASYCLGDIFYHGSESVEVNYPKALHYYHEAALMGHVDAMCCEGVMHFHGLGTEQDDTKAFYSYRAAALRGHIHACRNLAFMYKHGKGCTQSNRNAEYFLQLAEKLEGQCNQKMCP